MTKNKTKEILEEVGEIRRKVGWIDDTLDKIEIIAALILVILAIFGLGALISFISTLDLSVNIITQEDYCDQYHGVDSFYSSHFWTHDKLRSCDVIQENGEIKEFYFSIDKFNQWKKTKKQNGK